MAQKTNAQIGTIGIVFWGLSIFFAVSGFGKLTEATVGIGLVAFACYLGILARIAQASYIANKTNNDE
jgi:hypothetical protein